MVCFAIRYIKINSIIDLKFINFNNFKLIKGQVNPNPWDRQTMISVWRQALGLSMIPINKDRLADGLPSLVEGDSTLTALAQAAADKMANAGSFVNPDFSTARPNTLVVAMSLRGTTRINEYAFLLNQSKYYLIFC